MSNFLTTHQHIIQCRDKLDNNKN